MTFVGPTSQKIVATLRYIDYKNICTEYENVCIITENLSREKALSQRKLDYAIIINS